MSSQTITGAVRPLDEVILRHVRRTLDLAGGNKSQAARLLGISRRSLYRLLERETEVA